MKLPRSTRFLGSCRGTAFSLLLLASFAGRTFGQLTCPCDPNAPPYPGTPSEKDSWRDTKNGLWTLTCTNHSASGDFVWTYRPAGGAKKVIGRCIFVGGRNRSSVVRGADGNIAYFIHSCFDGGTDDGQPWDAVVNIFCKQQCTKIRMCLNYVGGQWVEDLAGREYTSASDFSAMSQADSDGDSVPDEGLLALTEGLYVPPLPPLPAEFEARVRLTSAFMGGNRAVAWNVLAMNTSMDPGDAVFIDSVSPSDVVSLDPNFVALPTTSGVELRAMNPVAPTTGGILATFAPVGSTTARYFVSDANAASFWSNLFALHPSVPLDALTSVTQTEMQDMPGFPGATGTINLGSTDVPLLPHPILYVVMGLLVVVGYALLNRRSLGG